MGVLRPRVLVWMLFSLTTIGMWSLGLMSFMQNTGPNWPVVSGHN